MSDNKVVILIPKGNLSKDDSMVSLVPYLKLKYNNGKERVLAPARKGGIEPVFESRAHIPLDSDEVEIEVCSKGSMWDGVLGKCKVSAALLKTVGGMPETKVTILDGTTAVGTLTVASIYPASGKVE